MTDLDRICLAFQVRKLRADLSLALDKNDCLPSDQRLDPYVIAASVVLGVEPRWLEQPETVQ